MRPGRLLASSSVSSTVPKDMTLPNPTPLPMAPPYNCIRLTQPNEGHLIVGAVTKVTGSSRRTKTSQHLYLLCNVHRSAPTVARARSAPGRPTVPDSVLPSARRPPTPPTPSHRHSIRRAARHESCPGRGAILSALLRPAPAITVVAPPHLTSIFPLRAT